MARPIVHHVVSLHLFLGSTLVLLNACQPPSVEEPPLFNAIDRSVQCESGEVGWNFSTGGTNAEPIVSEPIRGVRVLSAIYGGNVGSNRNSNLTDIFQRRCAGRGECEFDVLSYGDPFPGQNKDFVAEYTCGIEAEVYRVTVPPGGNVSRVKLSCGAVIRVFSADYGGNCRDTLRAAHTAELKTACDGKRQCEFDPQATLGDVAVGCAKKLRIEYRCGDRSELLVSETGQEKMSLACDVEPDPNGPQIRILQAAIGEAGVDVVDAVRTDCENEVACHYEAPSNLRGQTIWIQYSCGSEERFTNAYSDAGASGVTLSCSTGFSQRREAGIRVKSFVTNSTCFAFGSRNGTLAANSECYGKATCDFTYLRVAGCTEPYTATAEFSCGADPEIFTATSTGASLTMSCIPKVNIISASYGSACGERSGNYTTRVKSACANTRGLCEYQIPTSCAESTDMSVTYTCGTDPERRQSIKVDGEAVMLCPDPTNTISKKACVPAVCKGKKKRARNLDCVSAPSMSVVSQFELSSVSFRQAYASTLDTNLLYQNTPYFIRATSNRVGPNIKGRLTLWATERFESSQPGSPPVEGFACVVGDLDVDTGSDPTLPYRTQQLRGQISDECFAGKNTWGDAANRAGMQESAFRLSYLSKGMRIRASWDAAGANGYLRYRVSAPTSTQIGQMVMPNPPGFFYEKDLLWVDLISYYEQREVPIGDSELVASFGEPTTIDVGLNSAKLNTSSVALKQFDRQDIRMSGEFNWFMAGATRQNPFGPKAAYPGVENIADKLRAVFQIRPSDGDGDDWRTLGTVRYSDFGEALPTGRNVSVNLRLSDTIRNRMFDAWSTKDTYKLRVCLEANGVDPAPGSGDVPVGSLGSASVNGESYNARIAAGKHRCRMLSGTLAIASRDRVKRTLAQERASSATSNGDESSSGDDQTTSDADTAVENNCVPGSTSGEQVCTSYRRNGNRQGGTSSRSIYSSASQSRRVENGAGVTSSASMDAEVLGFTVIDGEDQEQEATVSKVEGAWQSPPTTKLVLTPNWDLIANSAKEATDDVKPVKPVIQKGRVLGLGGLAVGLGYKNKIMVGPFPGEVTVTATVAVTLGFELEVKYEPEQPYPCIGTVGTKCYRKSSAPLELFAAAKACSVSGGRLAELATLSERDGFVAATPGETALFWTGGSLGYRFGSGSCGLPTNQASESCLAGSTTYYRWGGSDRQFATSSGTSTALTVDTDQVGFAASKVQVTTSVPTPAGIAFDRGAGKLVTHSPSTLLDYVCEYDAAASTYWGGFSASFVLGAAAGVGVSFCTPDGDFGFCLSGQLNIIEAELKPGLEFSTFELKRTDGSMFGRRSNVKLTVPWEVWLLVGRIEASFNFLFSSVAWTLLEYKGLRIDGGNLFEYDFPAREDL